MKTEGQRFYENNINTLIYSVFGNRVANFCQDEKSEIRPATDGEWVVSLIVIDESNNKSTNEQKVSILIDTLPPDPGDAWRQALSSFMFYSAYCLILLRIN